ncbi:AraC family transcriptional regulator [Aestuariispira insulae]|uniref:Helix-turn-helix protein n=1 Tax=Aestuariispira insulae TaxID=1461337 RepID=A0A3D9H2G9_9PROT|nr:helix-turn-helix transcriptional regulator [Aestuariispira insulae]RED43717.1 helix-turn-helix protein [Aestuariispira insulae]
MTHALDGPADLFSDEEKAHEDPLERLVSLGYQIRRKAVLEHGFILCETYHPGSASFLEFRDLQYHSLCYASKGAENMSLQGREGLIQRGDQQTRISTRPSGSPYIVWHEGEARLYLLFFKLSSINRLLGLNITEMPELTLHHTQDIPVIFDTIIDKLEWENRFDGRALHHACVMLLQSFAFGFCDKKTEPCANAPSLTSPQRHLLENYMKIYLPKIRSVEELSDFLEISAQQFQRLFKNSYGMPPGQYLQHLRISKAKRLLTQSDLPITEIAQLCGYKNAAHFSERFRKATDNTPRNYRNSHSA